MQTSPRLDRVLVENRLGRLPLSEKQREREERIIAGTQILMTSDHANPVTIRRIAASLRMTTTTIRRYFIDVETILAAILLRHLRATYRAITKIPQDAPNRMALQRAAYLEATRHPWGGFSEAHLLFLRRRHTLPDDLAKPIEDMRQVIGEALGGEYAEAALGLLDTLHFQPHEIEAMLATYATVTTETAETVGWASAHQLQPIPTPQTEPPAATDANPAAPPPKPAQPQPPAQPTHKHYKGSKAARRQKRLQARAARAAAPPLPPHQPQPPRRLPHIPRVGGGDDVHDHERGG
jgi:AcrR family transcriptional regulator